jgi:protein involved in polysaccharide export with SLBB domain
MKISGALMAVCILCLFISPSILRAQDGSSASVDPNEYKIGFENNLQIDIYYGQAQKISQKIQVSSKGDIICPLIGEVHAQGLTVSALQKELTDMLGKDYLVNPQVIVSVEDYSTVSIIGEVKMPGSYPIKGKLTVVELISQAQGFTKIAAPNSVKIIRTNPDGTKKEILVRVYDIINKNADASDDVDLQDGDEVMVPESLF